MDNDKLKEASVNYVSKLLTNRMPLDDYREEFNSTEMLHEIRMETISDSESSVSSLRETIKMFSNKLPRRVKNNTSSSTWENITNYFSGIIVGKILNAVDI